MSLFDYLKKSVPKNKSQYPLVIASVATLIIAGVWVTTLPAQFSETKTNLDEGGKELPSITDLLKTQKSQEANVVQSDTEMTEPNTQGGTDFSNMDALNMNEASNTISGDSSGDPIIQTDDVAPNPGDIPTTTSPTPTTSYIYALPKPKMIRIGTTTKAE